jgi:hypothetical protein
MYWEPYRFGVSILLLRRKNQGADRLIQPSVERLGLIAHKLVDWENRIRYQLLNTDAVYALC